MMFLLSLPSPRINDSFDQKIPKQVECLTCNRLKNIIQTIIRLIV